ncbi:hypothetical protein ACFWFX_15455 [Streptomyces roseolus]|uniref:hypothetical protein n=1 Tax=Streptomyces roseolus TaxID=67358 RepID=UPI00364C2E3F
MGETMTRAQADKAVAEMAVKLTDEALCLAWMATEGRQMTKELALTRGWLMDELNRRLGNDLFDEWLINVDEDGNGVSPLAYFPS